MTSIEISGENGCWEMCNFPTPNDHQSYGSWDKSKNPYSLKYHIIPNSATAKAPGTTQPAASWVLGPDSRLTGNYVISQWV